MEPADEQEILVFGYACTVFRDDERALQVDRGALQIPWMGDPSMPIDRYDVRGLLSDLKKHEAQTPPLSREQYMSQEELCVEEMCDDERYRSMKIADEAEEKVKKEEEAKRAAGQGAAVGWSYSESGSQHQHQQQHSRAPPEISLHQMATVIEKTSEFIASQGAQMEILMRAKEAHNPKFQFLNPENPYHPIYKQVLEKKRARLSGKLLPSHTIHVPSLEEVEESLRNLTRNLPSAAPGISASSTSTSSPSAYSKLVEKLRVKTAPPPPPPTAAPPPAPVVKESTPPPPSQASAEDDENTVMVQVPPYEEQALIDQTASYVCRFGGDKLSIVKKRMPEKFAFLRSDNKYNNYYQFKVSLYNEMKLERQRDQKARAVASANAATAALQDPKHFPQLKGFFQ